MGIEHDTAGRRRRPATRGHLVAALAVVTGAALLTGCSSGSSSAGGSGSAGAGMSLAQTGGPVTVPVTTTQLSENDTKVVVQITVGGGAPVPVLLDTGSSGLIIDSSAVGSQVTSSGSTFASDFVSGAVTANLATAVVGIGGVDTPQPIQIGLVDPSDASKKPAGRGRRHHGHLRRR